MKTSRKTSTLGGNTTSRPFIAAILLLILVFVLFFPSCDSKEKGGRNSSHVSFNVMMKDDDSFKILYLTDLHFINSTVTSKKTVRDDLTLRDEWAKTAVTAVVQEAAPDMLVVSGDIVFTQNLAALITETNDNYAAFQKAAGFIDGFGIPWAFCFGNHDEEGSLLDEIGDVTETKKVLSEYLKSDSIKNCLYADGPDDINGCGNYIINVLNKNQSVNTSLVFFDSGSYIKMYDESKRKMVGGIWNYEYVHDDQLDWYESAIKDISGLEGRSVPSIVFQHIPLPIYQTVLDAYLAALQANGENWRDTINYDWVYGKERTLETEIGAITYHGGVCNKEKQEVAHSFVGVYNGVEFDGGHEFDRILSLGSTKYIFCGHDHRNTFSFTYKGVRLTYGMSIDYSAVGLIPESIYPNQNIYDETEQRGGTLVTLNEKGNTTIKQIPFARNLYRETLAERGLLK